MDSSLAKSRSGQPKKSERPLRINPGGRSLYRDGFPTPGRLELRAGPAALTPPLPTDGSFTLPFLLGAGLFVKTAFAELGIETGALDLPLEAAQRPLEALVVLNCHFRKDLTPSQGYGKASKAKTGPGNRSSPSLPRGSGQPPLPVERVGVEVVTVPMDEEVL